MSHDLNINLDTLRNRISCRDRCDLLLIERRLVTESTVTKEKALMCLTQWEAAKERVEHFPDQIQHSWAVKSTVARAWNL